MNEDEPVSLFNLQDERLLEEASEHKRMTDEELDRALEEQEWTGAKTYADTHPHWYFLRTENTRLFWELKFRIAEEGVDGYFYQTKFRYYYRGEYKYWGYDLVMNRDIPND